MISIINSSAPQLTQSFDRFLLDFLSGSLDHLEKKIIPLRDKKLRSIDKGKKREFEELLIKFRQTHERKKAEKAEYDAKIKDASERSCLPYTSKTCIFRRLES